MDTIKNFEFKPLSFIKVKPIISSTSGKVISFSNLKGKPLNEKRSDGFITLDNNIGFTFDERHCTKSEMFDFGSGYKKLKKYVLTVADKPSSDINTVRRELTICANDSKPVKIHASIDDENIKASLLLLQKENKLVVSNYLIKIDSLDSRIEKIVTFCSPGEESSVLKISEKYYDKNAKTQLEKYRRFRILSKDPTNLYVTDENGEYPKKVSGCVSKAIEEGFHHPKIIKTIRTVEQVFSAAFPGIMEFINESFSEYGEATKERKDIRESIKSEIEGTIIEECTDMKPLKYLKWKPNNIK